MKNKKLLKQLIVASALILASVGYGFVGIYATEVVQCYSFLPLPGGLNLGQCQIDGHIGQISYSGSADKCSLGTPGNLYCVQRGEVKCSYTCVLPPRAGVPQQSFTRNVNVPRHLSTDEMLEGDTVLGY